ncbi:MAG: tyrosine-type recombinase/integrase [Roseicyclus sp.]|uniref:tyrosine-type recombinase/integrase n=1 Tax=Roseicyclus sp. TaxID=1914329 RepID=UPI003A863A93
MHKNIHKNDIISNKPYRIEEIVPENILGRAKACHFANQAAIADLRIRNEPHFYALQIGRHIGVHRPNARRCNWIARILTQEKKYIQKCLGPAIDLGNGKLDYPTALHRAFQWFSDPSIEKIALAPRTADRTSEISICPTGSVYTVGHALRDYTQWTEIARSPGGHYNNLTLINHHLIQSFSNIPLEDFCATHLTLLARQVLRTPPRFGFMAYADAEDRQLSADEIRRRKRTFNSLVSILRMAFEHAWDNAAIESERPWRCLKRIPVVHSPRTTFLSRSECQRLLSTCTPALKKLVMAALYTGCRVGELGALRVEDVAKDVFGIRVGAFKRSPARFVFLPDEGMAFFLSLCEGKSARDYILHSDMGKVWKKQHTALFRRAVANAGLPKDFVFHGLRHTYASDLVASGVPLDIVAKQLGHANTITVSNTYGHLVEKFREDQIRTRFTLLSEHWRAEADRRRGALDVVSRATQPQDWRSYAAVSITSSNPRKSYSRTHADVLKIFGAAEAKK